MKRRIFLKQSLAASAVFAGAGYGSFELIRSGSSPAVKSIAQRGAAAAADVAADGNPAGDEGMPGLVSHTQSEARPQFHVYSRPASANAQYNVKHGSSGSSSSEASAVRKPSADPVHEKVANFEADFHDDVILTAEDYQMLVASLERINRVQAYVGFGNFNILSFDDALRYARYSPRIGEFTKAELGFLETMFQYDSSQLGFFGEKVIRRLTHTIAERDVIKMPGTGHYIYRGYSEAFYRQIRREIGDSLILTSGVRNVIKQYQLFLAKTVQASGNLSRASRSLAPPGHSYHAIGDFDVGQAGAGRGNFTAAFADTDEFRKLQELGYVKIRYTADNKLGVRYEPWHIRVV